MILINIIKYLRFYNAKWWLGESLQIILVSYGGYNKLPQGCWFKTKGMLSYSSGVEKSQMDCQGCVPAGGSGRIHFLAFSSFQRLPSSLGSWPHIAPASTSALTSLTGTLLPPSVL